jgi:putative inorganic carbon (hco3(-)) transporter
MVYRAAFPDWTPAATLLATAVLVGVLAGVDPKYGLAAVIGLGFVAIVLSNLALGLCLFAVATFLDVLPFGGAAVTFAKAAGFLLLMSWLAKQAEGGERRGELFEVHPVFTYVVVAFLAWVAASMVWAEDPSAAFSATYRYALNMVLFLIVFAAIRTERAVTWIASAFLFGALISAAYGLAFPAQDSGGDIARLGGAGTDPNELAAILVAGLVLAAAFFIGDNPPFLRGIALAVMPLCAMGVLFSFSRTGLVALAVALIGSVAFGGRWRWSALALLLVITVGMTTYLVAFADPQARDRVTKLDGGTGREDIWAVGARMIRDNPIDGVGGGNFPVSSVHYLLEPGALQRAEFIVDTPKVAHNMLIDVWAELGLVGFTLFLGILAFSVSCTARAAWAFSRVGNDRMELLARAFFIGQLAYLSGGLFLSQQYSKQLWLLLALGPALLEVARSAEEAAEEQLEESEVVSPRYAEPAPA